MNSLNISPRDERKRLWRMDSEVREAIANACRYLNDDRKIAQYIAAPHEGISEIDVAIVRKREISAGRILCNDYSPHRRGRVGSRGG
jgi:hypothetical protein